MEDRTSEPWYVPWIAVEAIFLFGEEPEMPVARQQANLARWLIEDLLHMMKTTNPA
jgi:hypothetical protein